MPKKQQSKPRHYSFVESSTSKRRTIGRPKDNTRRRKAAVALLQNPNLTKTEAAIQAGFPESVARSHTERIFDSDTQAYMRKVAKEEGMDERVWLHKAISLTDAGEIVVINAAGDTVERPDNTARLSALRLVGEATGYIKSQVNYVQVVQHVADNLIELVMPFIPKGKHAAFFAEAERRFGERRVGA